MEEVSFLFFKDPKVILNQEEKSPKENFDRND